MELINVRDRGELKGAYRGWVEEALEESGHERRPEWTESIAVGSESFLRAIKERLGIRAKGRKVVGGESRFELREISAPYVDVFGGGKCGFKRKKHVLLEAIIQEISTLAWSDPNPNKTKKQNNNLDISMVDMFLRL